jgi:hypothetical protein
MVVELLGFLFLYTAVVVLELMFGLCLLLAVEERIKGKARPIARAATSLPLGLVGAIMIVRSVAEYRTASDLGFGGGQLGAVLILVAGCGLVLVAGAGFGTLVRELRSDGLGQLPSASLRISPTRVRARSSRRESA